MTSGSGAPRVKLNDFQAQWNEMGPAAIKAVERVGESGWWILGAEVSAFERALASRWGLAEAAGCGSGLDAIEIALRCLDLEPGRRVLTTPLSAFATSLAILRAGGVPVFADVDATGLLDLGACERHLRRRRDIGALVPVHLYGHALDLDRLEALSEEFGVPVVEDCAQAIGASSRGRPVGSAGRLAAASFYPTKNLGGMGDGGAVLTSDPELAARARRLRDYGQRGKFVHDERGLNSRLDEIQAAILRDAILPGLEARNARRAEIAARYLGELRSASVECVAPPGNSSSAWHLFPVLVRGSRDAFLAHLDRCGVSAGVHYPTLIPDQGALSGTGAVSLEELPRAREFAAREASLPVHPYLTDADVERVIEACRSWKA